MIRPLTRRMSANLSAQKSANSGRASRASTSLTRRSGRRVGQERADLGGRGQHAEDVERRPADELGVGAGRRRLDPHPVELAEHRAVDRVVLRDLGGGEPGDRHQVRQPDRGDQAEVMRDHRDLAGPLERDVPVGVDLGDRRSSTSCSSRAGSRRGSSRRRSAPPRRSAASVAGASRSRDPGAISRRTGFGAAGSSFAPSAIQSRRISNDFDPRASRSPPSCGTWPSGLVMQQARVGRQDVDPPPARLAGDGHEVLVGQVAAEAEAEPSLAGRRPVAGPHVAVRLAERRDHVVPEADPGRRGHPRNLDDRPRLRPRLPPGDDRRRAHPPAASPGRSPRRPPRRGRG